MKNIYLDHNVYIQASVDNTLYNFLLHLKNDINIKFLYSPAHIEEIYKVKSNEDSKLKNQQDKLIENISSITCDNETFPTHKGIIIKKENPLECYKRVKDNDTTKLIESHGELRRRHDCENFKKFSEREKKLISSMSFTEIWEHELVKSELNKLNNKTNRYNLLCTLFGFGSGLSQNFSFKKGNFNILKNSFHDLEFAIQELFDVLNFCGYKGERNQRTNTSRIHDVTHAIYATKADYLISADSKFVYKCKAVYYYLGVPTQVIHTEQSNIKNTLNNIIGIK